MPTPDGAVSRAGYLPEITTAATQSSRLHLSGRVCPKRVVLGLKVAISYFQLKMTCPSPLPVDSQPVHMRDVIALGSTYDDPPPPPPLPMSRLELAKLALPPPPPPP